MWRPRAADSRFFVDEHASTRRCKGSAIEVEQAVDLGPRREAGIDAGSAEEIKGLEGLREEAIPEIEGK